MKSGKQPQKGEKDLKVKKFAIGTKVFRMWCKNRPLVQK